MATVSNPMWNLQKPIMTTQWPTCNYHHQHKKWSPDSNALCTNSNSNHFPCTGDLSPYDAGVSFKSLDPSWTESKGSNSESTHPSDHPSRQTRKPNRQVQRDMVRKTDFHLRKYLARQLPFAKVGDAAFYSEVYEHVVDNEVTMSGDSNSTQFAKQDNEGLLDMFDRLAQQLSETSTELSNIQQQLLLRHQETINYEDIISQKGQDIFKLKYELKRFQGELKQGYTIDTLDSVIRSVKGILYTNKH